MVTKTYRFHWWDIDSTSWDKTPPHKSLSKDLTWTLASDNDCYSYAKYKASDIGAYKFEEIYNNEEQK